MQPVQQLNCRRASSTRWRCSVTLTSHWHRDFPVREMPRRRCWRYGSRLVPLPADRWRAAKAPAGPIAPPRFGCCLAPASRCRFRAHLLQLQFFQISLLRAPAPDSFQRKKRLFSRHHTASLANSRMRPMVSAKAECAPASCFEKFEQLRAQAYGRVQLWIRAAGVGAQIDQVLRALVRGQRVADLQRSILAVPPYRAGAPAG